MMGSLKMVPSKMFLMVPFGDLYISFNLYSTTLFLSGVMVAHLIPTLVLRIALPASIVILSLVLSLY